MKQRASSQHACLNDACQVTRARQQQIARTMTAIALAEKQLRKFLRQMDENRSEGLRKYREQSEGVDATTATTKILDETCEKERDLAAKVQS